MVNTLRPLSISLAFLLCSCGGEDTTSNTKLSAPVDADGDGYPEEHDCDDQDASRNPGATEVCDGIDQDCDDLIDENASDFEVFYADNDGDGYGDPANERLACDLPSGFVVDSTDCDDTDAEVSPEGIEVCNDYDDDCDGLIDVEDPNIPREQVYLVWPDLDDDGHGDSSSPQIASCNDRNGVSLDNLDCDDTDPATWIGAARLEAPDTCMQDIDNDGWGSASPTNQNAVPGSDCDDGAGLINPGARETCDDSLDNDCDSDVDEGCGP